MKLTSTLLLLSFVFGLRAAEETTKHRVIGLSEPDRQNDFREVIRTLPGVELVSLDLESTEATLKYDPAKLISNYNPKKPPTAEAIAKRLEELLQSAAHGTFSLKPVSTVAKDKLKAEEIGVGVLDCKGCRYGAYIAIAKIDGVERATVSSEKSTLTAWIDPSKTNRAALEDALKKAHIEMPSPLK